ncbi:HTH domain-containing protein [Candidatus Pacearchaeota archaeon]|nr:HTH domain-containing protein [Candidatus Pacearchaeota archaeon]
MKKSITKSPLKSTVNRTNMKGQILNILKNLEKPLSTAEIAQNLNKSWHTIIRYCLDLENESKLIKFEIGRISAWQIKK